MLMLVFNIRPENLDLSNNCSCCLKLVSYYYKNNATQENNCFLLGFLCFPFNTEGVNAQRQISFHSFTFLLTFSPTARMSKDISGTVLTTSIGLVLFFMHSASAASSGQFSGAYYLWERGWTAEYFLPFRPVEPQIFFILNKYFSFPSKFSDWPPCF